MFGVSVGRTFSGSGSVSHLALELVFALAREKNGFFKELPDPDLDPRPAAKRPRATQPAPKTKKKPRTKKPPPKPPAPEPPAPKRRYDPEEACAICLEPLGDAPQLPGCSHRLHAACVLGPDSLASHAWAENRPSLRRGQQVVCPVCRKTSWIPPGFL